MKKYFIILLICATLLMTMFTTNPEILKTANLGFIKVVGGSKYDPQRLIACEEMATILFRALKVIIPDEDYSASGDFKFFDRVILNFPIGI